MKKIKTTMENVKAKANEFKEKHPKIVKGAKVAGIVLGGLALVSTTAAVVNSKNGNKDHDENCALAGGDDILSIPEESSVGRYALDNDALDTITANSDSSLSELLPESLTDDQIG